MSAGEAAGAGGGADAALIACAAYKLAKHAKSSVTMSA
jgi:hypothetical protein